MRKVLIALVAISVLCLLAIRGDPVVAGDYHKGPTLVCSDCHTMHFSQSHGYNANGTGIFTPLGTGGPYGYLLRNEINDLCLTCHDGQTFAPDVMATQTGTAVRQAGALNRFGLTTGGYFESDGHTLDVTGVTAPGGTWAPDPSQGLVCIDCHSAHGRTGPGGTNLYRNMAPNAGDISSGPAPTYNDVAGVQDLTRDVFERTFASYDMTDVDFMEPDATASAYGNWCKRCHTDFHGAVGGAEIGGTGAPPEHFLRHPTAGVDIGALGGGHSSKSLFGSATKQSWVKVMTQTGLWQPAISTDVTDHTPSCFTCHKAHGNQNAFGLIYMDPNDATMTEEGSAGGTYKNLCKQCHVQG